MALSDNARGIMIMCVAMAAFTVNDTAVKAATQTLPLFQVIALRGALSLVGLIALGLAKRSFAWHMSRRDAQLVGLRMAAEVTATLLFLFALVHMPLANLSAIMQFVPLAVTMAAALVFGQTIGWRRMTAIMVGLVGVLIIIRPGSDGFDVWSMLGLASVGFVVIRDLSSSRISARVSSVTVSVWSSLAVTLTGLAGAMVEGWQPMTLHETGIVTFSAAFLVVGYLTAVGSMRVGDIAVIAPFRYTALLWAIVLGYMLFGTHPDLLTMVGSALVVASGVYSFWREARLRARAA